MRFDYRGMGDSSGELRHFEQVAPDLRAAIDAFFGSVKELRDVVIWGLCDAASTALLYAHNDERVSGLVLLNPWVRTTESEARTYIRHYYVRRLLEGTPWRKLLRGELDIKRSAVSLVANLRRAARVGSIASQGQKSLADTLPERMAVGLERFGGRVLLILSGNDLTAKEFCDTSDASVRWRRLLASSRITRHELPQATHTFSRREWRDKVAAWTSTWVQSW
jgi:exosortase A-associated hydrolase 1